MSLSTCTIQISQGMDRTITITRSLRRQLQLANSRSLTLSLGSKTVTANVRTVNRDNSVITIPAAIATMLRIPYSGKCMVRGIAGKQLQFGPLVGVLTSASGPLSRPFGARTEFIKELMRTGTNRAYMVAFAPQHVNWKEQLVTGYMIGKDGSWVRKLLPLPDVVYNRLPSRIAEKSSSMEGFKERFVRRKIPLFNWSFFDKWDVYRLLDGDMDAGKYVPESINSPSAAEIKALMEKHRFVYLKPTSGSLGIGIYRLTYNPKRGYFARFRQNGSNVLIRFPRFEGLFRHLQKQRVNTQRYVVQQGIRLIEIDNCPIDFRFHMTKNGHNEWVTSGIGAKQAGKGSVTTHMRTGGKLLTPEQVLSRVFGLRADAILQHAKQVAIKLATSIERNYSKPLGELGFDLGIDLNEKVWMFEANAKPGRSIFKHPSLKEQGRTSLTNILEHCQYLSRFTVRREGN